MLINAGETLTWKQSKFFNPGEFLVLKGDRVVGKMKCYGRRLAVAEAEGSKWTFKIEDFLEKNIEVIKEGVSEKVILETSLFNSKVILKYSGKEVSLLSMDWMERHCVWLGENKEEILEIKQKLLSLKGGGKIVLKNPKGYDYMLLIFLAIYLMSQRIPVP